MTLKTVVAPLTFAGLAALVVFMQPHISCVVMVVAKFAGHVTL
ncbi:MAG: hypothetical protein WA715_20925 [Candidatus Acidiferrum sp.]|jgi:hypothetical protein